MSTRIVSITHHLRRLSLVLALLSALVVAAVAGPPPAAYAQGPITVAAARATAVAVARNRYHAMKQAQFEARAGAVYARPGAATSLARLRYENLKDQQLLRSVR